MEVAPSNVWRKCSSCKKPILLGAKYFVCSVSTCNGLRTGYVFCSLPCFETHLPGARHKQAGAIEKIAPRTQDPVDTTSSRSLMPADGAASGVATGDARSPSRIMIKPSVQASNSASTGRPGGSNFGGGAVLPQEILVIASRLKEYITAKADYNTSANVMDVLSDYLRILCDRGIENARAEGRKTVLDRDFDFLKKS